MRETHKKILRCFGLLLPKVTKTNLISSNTIQTPSYKREQKRRKVMQPLQLLKFCGTWRRLGSLVRNLKSASLNCGTPLPHVPSPQISPHFQALTRLQFLKLSHRFLDWALTVRDRSHYPQTTSFFKFPFSLLSDRPLEKQTRVLMVPVPVLVRNIS